MRAGNSSATFLTLGCILQDWQVQHRGEMRGVVLGYEKAAAYYDNPFYLGAVIGRVANRVSGAAFSMNGQRYQLPANEGENLLHSGATGLHAQIWQVQRLTDGQARFSYHSPDGDAGYPAAVDFSVTVTLAETDNGVELTWEMDAIPDRETPINMTQHSYFNLAGGNGAQPHDLLVAADKYTPTAMGDLPDGRILPLIDSPYDFQAMRRLRAGEYIDLNFALTGKDSPAAILRSTDGIEMVMHTNQPGLQVYTAADLMPHAAPLARQTHSPFSGIALEPQGFPDAINRSQFPSILCSPDQPYSHKTQVEISSEP